MKTNSCWALKLMNKPTSRLDLSSISPMKFSQMKLSEIINIDIFDGNILRKLGDFFQVKLVKNKNLPFNLKGKIIDVKNLLDEPCLAFYGDLSMVDNLGKNMKGGRIFVFGNIGNYVGVSMNRGYIEINGSAGLHTGCAMTGGFLNILKDVGDFSAGALPGQLQGVTGGVLFIHGCVGKNFGNLMRRGLAVISRNAGNYLAYRMIAGTIAIGGNVGEHCGYGMKRGTLVFSKFKPEIPSTFITTNHDFSSFWGILSAELKLYGKPFLTLEKRKISRVVGDIAFGGKGEWLFCDD